MLTGEILHLAFCASAPPDEINLTWAGVSKQDKARYTAMAALLNTHMRNDGAAERDALRSHISQLQAQIDGLTETVLRVEAERDAFQQLARAMGIQESGHA